MSYFCVCHYIWKCQFYFEKTFRRHIRGFGKFYKILNYFYDLLECRTLTFFLIAFFDSFQCLTFKFNKVSWLEVVMDASKIFESTGTHKRLLNIFINIGIVELKMIVHYLNHILTLITFYLRIWKIYNKY